MTTLFSLVGIVRVKFDSLIFPAANRQKNPKIISQLKDVFEEGAYGCDREHENNIIPACITRANLASIFYESNLTQQEIQSSLVNKTIRPTISAGNLKFYCFWGLQRIEAAKQILREEEQWWTIRLYTWDGTYSSLLHVHILKNIRW